ncbi:vWA domain-containing protein [Mesohalobacter halotolerans]|nr:VWA domain-containing protein [Mesohalobacter halotolerans]
MKRPMNKQDKLYDKIKKAAQNQEQQAFDQKEKVWSAITDKLNPKKRKRMILYRTLSTAAVIAVLIFTGFQFLDSTNPIKENPIINTDVKLNENSNNEVVKDTKQEPNSTENLDRQYLESVENEIDTPKPTKTEAIVANEIEAKTIEDTAEIDGKKAVSRNAEEQRLVLSSAENGVIEKKDSNPIKNSRKIQIAVLDNNVSQNKTPDNAIVSTTNEKNVEDTDNVENLIPVSGEVIDIDGLPIPGVNVIVKGTQKSTQTNFDGQFTIDVKIGKILRFAYVGFKTKEVKIQDSNDLTVTLEANMEALEEVVVAAYGRKPKRAKTGSVKIKSDAEVNETLQGRVAGVQINSAYGEPDHASNIRIRGNTSIKNQQPLYIVDGKPMNVKELGNLNPKAIKSVNVIKTKSELFMRGYAEKAKNGVIEISTQNEKDSDINPDSIVNWYNQHIHYYTNNEDYESFKENPFTSPLSKPLSTFSIDVDRAAYTNIRRMINSGQDVPKDAVRIEEMLNFFEYDYDRPKDKHPFAIHTTYSDAPWNDKHKLLRIALQGKDIPLENLPVSNLVFLIDVSGSMNNQNKLPLVKKSLNLLVDQLRGKDKIALVTYAGNSQVVLQPTSGQEKTKIKKAINTLSSGGGTYASQGIETAYSLAEENFVKDGNNRVIIATDGDFNIGVTQSKSLEDLIAKKRKTNIFLTCLGYGMGNYKDSKMQSLSQKGNGNYAYIDTYQEAQKFLEREFKGSLYAIAKDVKIQIEFNPKHVDSYRLIGYETRLLQDQDFADDTKDAGEIGVNHQVTALYEVVPRGVKSSFGEFKPDLKYQQVEEPKLEGYSDELATVKFRYKKPDSETSSKIERIIKNKSVNLKNADADFKFATAVAWFGLKLRDSQLISKADKADIIELAKQGLENDKEGYRAEFIRLVRLYN